VAPGFSGELKNGTDVSYSVDAGLAATATDAGILLRSTRKRRHRGPS
jgi:hypothetical protein